MPVDVDAWVGVRGGAPVTERWWPTDQVEHFFETSFSDGDAEIRRGFQAYVAAVGEDDPVRRQELMFQANTLVATHEQAGAQPYLNEVMSGVPDGFASRYVDIAWAATGSRSTTTSPTSGSATTGDRGPRLGSEPISAAMMDRRTRRRPPGAADRSRHPRSRRCRPPA